MSSLPESAPRAVIIEPVRDEGSLASALAIREVVFIEEQHVPESTERDACDGDAYHVLAVEGGHAVGTGRLVMLEQTPKGLQGIWGQIGRMAVLEAHRGGGLGGRILGTLEEEARRRGCAGIILHAQVHAHEFYRRSGYTDHGPIFEEAGMPHIEMRKLLGAAPEPGHKASHDSSSRGRQAASGAKGTRSRKGGK